MRSESQLAGTLGFAAIAVLLMTVCVVPWIHGGTIPLARLVLQMGACLAGVLSLLSGLLGGKTVGFPPVVFPLGMLVCVGVVQLLPVHAPMVGQMNHAVLEEWRNGFMDSDSSMFNVRSGSPADTRSCLAQLIAIMLLATTAYDQVRSQRAIRVVLSVLAVNAVVFSLLALAQIFHGELFLIRPEWWTGLGTPFGSFVNPNNAAGWLSFGIAASMGLLVMQIRQSVPQSTIHRFARRSLFSRATEYLAGLTASHITTWCCLAAVVCALVATGSRAAMVSACTAFLLVVLLRMRRQQAFGTLAFGTIAALGCYGLVAFFGFDGLAVRELRTLSDPVGELAPRIEHWRDSLLVAMDFPLIGAGLGAYRFVTLPYQTHDNGAWFQHADNQYVEMLVESGVMGTLAFVWIGMGALIGASRSFRRSVAGGASVTEEAVGLVLFFCLTMQGLSSFLDFGSSLPASSSLLVVLISIQAATRGGLRQSLNSARWAGLAVRFLLVVGAGLFIADLAAAQRCYLTSIAAAGVSRMPITAESLNQREMILERANEVLEWRVDDADVNEVISRFGSDLLRAEYVRGLPHLDQEDNLEKVWPYTSSIAIVRSIDGAVDEPALHQHLQSVFETRLKESGLIAHCNRVQEALPISGRILRRAAMWVEAANVETEVTKLSVRARFSEPSDADLGLQLGEMALRRGWQHKAEVLFGQVIRVDPTSRRSVLDLYESMNLLDLGFERFGPRDFTEAVIAMRGQSDSVVVQRLQSVAAEYWNEPRSRPSVELQLSRSAYLGRLKDYSGQEAWLQKCVAWSPRNLQIRSELANVLSRLGQSDEAHVAWHEVLRLDPHNSFARRQVERTMAAIRGRKESQKASVEQ